MSMMKRGDEVDDDFIQENHFMLRSIQKLNWGVEKRPNKSQNVEKDRKSLKNIMLENRRFLKSVCYVIFEFCNPKLTFAF